MNSERGAALVVALMTLLFLTLLGGALLSTSTIDIWIGENYKTGTQSLYVAEAGIEHARETIRGSLLTASQLLAGAAGGDGMLSGATDPMILLASNDVPLFNNTTLNDATGRTIGTYHVYLRNDYGDGMTSLADTNQVLNLLTFSTVGDSRKVIEVTIRKGKFPKMPAALTLDGPVDVFDPTDSTIFEVDGNDMGAANQDENAIGVMNDSDIGEITGELLGPPNRTANYTGTGGGTPDVANTESEMDARLKTVAGLESIVAGIAANANDVYNPAYGSATTIGNIGNPSNYRVVVVNGDVNLGPGTGYGVLVTRGALTVSGSFTWNGLILIIGQGELHWNGGGYGAVNGGMFLARTRDDDRTATNLLGTLLTSRGEIIADFNGGGGSGIHYNTSAIEAANSAFPYTVISRMEH